MQRVLFTALLILAAGCTDNPDSPVAGSNLELDSESPVLKEFVASQFQANAPGGVVLVRSGRQVLLRAAFGLSDVEAGLPLDIAQSLPIGSITKSFTAGAILRLVDSGQISLEDDVRKYVPDAPVNGYVVTIEQLLTHTSGLPNLVDNPGFFSWAQEKRDTAELLEQTEGVPFLFESGTGFAYSDSGYILLGAVLENFTSGNWSDAIHDLVAQPLGLESVRAANQWSDHSVVGYLYQEGRFKKADTIDWSVPHASGALVANVDDLFAWIRAWETEAFITPELREQAWSARTLPDGTHSGYGFGWKRCDFEGTPAIQHGGYVPGFTASILYLPEKNLTAIALLNSEGRVEASYLTRQALRLILTGKPEITGRILSSKQRERLFGTYRTERGKVWTVTQQRENLVLETSASRIELTALTETQLCAAESDGTWCFTFDVHQGAPASLVAMSLTCEPQGRALRLE